MVAGAFVAKEVFALVFFAKNFFIQRPLIRQLVPVFSVIINTLGKKV